MVILGLSDGVDAGAALVIDNELVAVEVEARHDRVARSRSFPWGAIDAVLEEAGIGRDQVEQVALAGQFSPPLLLRKHPGLRRVARGPFSPIVDWGVFFQAVIRQTGLGAWEGDRISEWLEGELRSNGFSPRRVLVTDAHKALAEAAYRTQPFDEVLVVSLHPMGDGVACAVHHGADGQLDKTWAQRGFSALHVHLSRCAAAMGFDPLLDQRRIWSMAAAASPDARLVERLATEMYAVGPRLSRRNYPFPESPLAPLYRELAEADPATAAASVLQNLCTTVRDLVRHHIEASGVRRIALAGSVFENPRLVAAIADMNEVESVWAPPEAGGLGLALGSALGLGGVAPARLASPAWGRQYHRRQFERALRVAGVTPVSSADEADGVAAVLAAGGTLARFQGRSGAGPHGSGTRSLLMRADDPAVVARARSALRRSMEEECVAIALDQAIDEGVVRQLRKVSDGTRFGTTAVHVDSGFAARYPAVVGGDGRVILQRTDLDADPGLHAILQALFRKTGCAVLACLPLAEGNEAPVAVPSDALRVWRRSGSEALLLGPFVVSRT